MKIEPAWKYIFAAGITLTAIVTVSASLFKPDPTCYTSEGQTVVRWKSMYYGSCRLAWNGNCIWPIHRPHNTYKVTVNEGVPVRNENGQLFPVAEGKIRKWQVYDSTLWNSLGNKASRWRRIPDYEPIAENDYVVEVETRYWLFHNVEANLRICTQNSKYKP